MTRAWNKCPKCKSNKELVHGYWFHDVDSSWRTKTCSNCGFSWNEVFKFYSNEDPETCKELDEKGE